MNIFQRFFRIIRANVNQLLSGMEDPEKLINQTVTDMQKSAIVGAICRFRESSSL
jgi:phage shock protein A